MTFSRVPFHVFIDNVDVHFLSGQKLFCKHGFRQHKLVIRFDTQ